MGGVAKGNMLLSPEINMESKVRFGSPRVGMRYRGYEVGGGNVDNVPSGGMGRVALWARLFVFFGFFQNGMFSLAF